MSEKRTFCRLPGPGETRMCTDPWSFVYVRASGDVELCCRGEVVGNLREAPLAAILDGPRSRRIRAGLWCGDLAPGCRACPRTAIATLAELRRAVERELFEADLGALEALRRELRDHRRSRAELLAERDALHGHVANLERERPHLVAHVANLEAERAHLVAHVANLERERALRPAPPARPPWSARFGLRRLFSRGVRD